MPRRRCRVAGPRAASSNLERRDSSPGNRQRVVGRQGRRFPSPPSVPLCRCRSGPLHERTGRDGTQISLPVGDCMDPPNLPPERGPVHRQTPASTRFRFDHNFDLFWDGSSVLDVFEPLPQIYDLSWGASPALGWFRASAERRRCRNRMERGNVGYSMPHFRSWVISAVPQSPPRYLRSESRRRRLLGSLHSSSQRDKIPPR